MKNEKQEQLYELTKLKNKLEDQLSYEKKNKIKNFHIRNLKVFEATCKFTAPFAIFTGIFIGVVNFFGGGLPFHKDDIPSYKVYSLELNNNEIETYEGYYPLGIFDSLQKNGEYTRFKREYNFYDSVTLSLYNAIIESNYDYVKETLKDYKEEIQKTNIINNENNDYIVEASIHLFDKEDILFCKEEDIKNIFVTLVEMIFGSVFGYIINRLRRFNYCSKLQKINDEYYLEIALFNETKKELSDVNKKILSLKRMV